MSVPTLPASAHPLAQKIQQIIEELSTCYLERRHVIEAVWLTILCKQNGFILGPPGTGKTSLVRAIFERILDKIYFEVQLSMTKPSEKVLGPTDIPKLRDTGDLVHKIEGYLPTANFANLDEIWKMSPSLGHDLLTICLDHRLHQVQTGQVDSWIEVPIYSVVGGSNELPEGDNQEAMFDRTLVRVIVDYIVESGNFAAMLVGSTTMANPTTVEFKDLADVIDNVIPFIPIPLDVQEAVLRLRDALRSEDIVPSDRRWKQCMRLLQAAAWLRGATQVEEDDIQVLRYALWDTPAQVQKVERATLTVANPAAEAAMALMDDIEDIARNIRELKGQASETRAQYGTEASGKIRLIQADLGTKRQEAIAAGRSTTKFDEVADKIASVKRSLYIDLLGMDPSALK